MARMLGTQRQRAERIQFDHKERTTGIGAGHCVACRERWPCEPWQLAEMVLKGKV